MEAMSTATSRPEYATLLAKTLPAIIHSEKENEHYRALLEELDHRQDKLTPAEQRLAELLTLLIEDFEEKHYSSRPATGIEALEELMEANSLKQKDLVSMFGTPSIISEVLNGKVSPELFF
jgi:HTH-type transcriptional regulator/antitoxin HigA